MSNKLSRNWTTGYTSPFCTLWGSCNLGLSLRRTQNFEESLTQFHTSQAWACWPLKGIGKDQSGPPRAVGQVLASHRQPWAVIISRCPPEHPSPLGLTVEVSPSGDPTAGTQSFVRDSKSAGSRHSFSFGKPRLFFLLQPPLFNPVWPFIKGKASPTKAPELYFTREPFLLISTLTLFGCSKKAASLQTPLFLLRKHRRHLQDMITLSSDNSHAIISHDQGNHR